jgi:O-antigen/teichoic acid export membrane protein
MKVVALSLGQGMARVIGLATMMVMARLLTKEDLAAYRQTLLAYAFVAPFIGLGIGQGIYYFLPAEKLRVRGRVFDAITILAGMGALFALFLALGGNELLAKRFSNPEVARLLLWMIPYAIVTAPAGQCPSVLVARDQVMQSSVFQVTRQFFIGIATVVPVLIWQTAEAPLIGNVVASVLFGFEAIRLMIKATPKDSKAPSRDGMAEMLKFSVPLGMATMVGTMSLQLDKMIVAMMCTPEEFVVYSLGAIEIPFLSVVTGAVTIVMLADMRKAISAGRKDETLRLFKMTAEKTSLIIFPVMLFLLVCADPFIQTLFGGGYAESADAFRIYLFKLPYRIVVFGSILMALGENLFILKRSLISLVIGAVLKVALVSYVGPLGAVTGAVIVAYLYVVPGSLIVISKGIGVSFFETLPLASLGKKLLMSLPVAAAGGVVVYVLGDQPPIMQLGVAAMVVAPYCLWWWNGELYSFSVVISRLKSAILPSASDGSDAA